MKCTLTITVVSLLIFQTASPVFAQGSRSKPSESKTSEASKTDGARSTIGTKFDRRAEKFRLKGMYKQAEPVMKRSLSYKEQRVGPDTPEVAVSLNNLAMLYQEQSQYAKAEPLHLRALAIRVKALGLDHHEVAETLRNLTALYKAQDQQAKADALPTRAREIWEKRPKPDKTPVTPVSPVTPTPTVVKAKVPRGRPKVEAKVTPVPGPQVSKVKYAAGSWDGINVALMQCQRVHDFQRSTELAEKALAAAKGEFGRNHPNTARSLNNLGYIYQHKGRYADAKELYDRALKIWQKTPEPDHADIVITMDNLARLYSITGFRRRVDELNRRTMKERELIPQADRPDLTKLAVIDENTRILGEENAEPFDLRLRRATAGYKAIENLHVAVVMHDLAWRRYHGRGQFAYAEQLNKMALETRRKLLEQPHRLVGESLYQLARGYAAQGEFDRPKRLYKEALEIFAATIGPKDSHFGKKLLVMVTQQNLYDLHDHRAHHYQIEEKMWEVNHARNPMPPLSEDIRKSRREAEGRWAHASPDAITNLTVQARVLAMNRNYAFALPLYKGALKLMDDEHPLYAQTLRDLAALRVAQDESHLAKPLYELAKVAAPKARPVDKTPKALPDSIELADSLLQGSRAAQPESAEKPGASKVEAIPDRWEAFEPRIRKHIDAREYELAGAEARAAVAFAELTYGPYHSNVALSLNMLAAVYILEGRFGVPLYLRALEIWESVPTPDTQGLKTTLDNLRGQYQRHRQSRKLSALANRERMLRERISLKGPPKTPESTAPDQSTILSRPVPAEEEAIAIEWSRLTSAFSDLYNAKDFVRAEAVAKKSLQVIERSLHPGFPNVATSLGHLALAYTSQGMHALAEPLLEHRLKMIEEVHEPYHRSVIAAIDTLAKTYEAQGKQKLASAVRERFTEEGLANKAVAGASPRNETKNQAWARAINDAPLLTKAQRGALLKRVSIHPTSNITEGLDLAGLSTVKAEIIQYLKLKGITEDSDSETVLFLHYRVKKSDMTVSDRRVGSVFGIAVEARLSRRGYVFHQNKAHPVIAVISRSLARGAVTDESRIDLMSHVKKAVVGLFKSDSVARVEGHQEATLIHGKGDVTLKLSRMKFEIAELSQKIAAGKAIIGKDNLKADDPMRDYPIWATLDVNVHGNPFAEGLPLHFAGAGMPVFSDLVPMPKMLREASESAWIRALPPDGGVGSEATLSYILYRSNVQSVSDSKYYVLFSDVLISHPNVLVKLDKNRFARTPAYIFLRFDVNIESREGIYAYVQKVVQDDVNDTGSRLKGPWLWADFEERAPDK